MSTTSRLHALTPAENAWLDVQSRAAEGFVATWYPEWTDESLTPDSLDRAYAAWRTSPDAPGQANAVINAVGVAFGQELAERLGLTWVIADDKYGTELALHGLPGTADVLIFPQNLVAKRYEAAETGFQVRLFDAICADAEGRTPQANR